MMTGAFVILEYWTLLYLDDDWRVGDIGILDKQYLEDDRRVGDIVILDKQYVGVSALLEYWTLL